MIVIRLLKVVFLVAVFTLGANATAATAVPTPVPPSQSFDVYLTRHHDKLSEGKDPELSDKGKRRAELLMRYLHDVELEAVLTTRYQRTMQTALPVATSHGMHFRFYSPSGHQAIVDEVLAARRPLLIVGHSNTIPDVINRFGGNGREIDENEYGVLFKLSFDSDGLMKYEEVHISVDE